MNSFYGGKQGRSYAIIKHFDSYEDMVSAFQLGAGYTEVNYGEYVIIDTIVNNNNPNHPDNGKIYRRGINFENDQGGAIYVGQIQGTEGKMSPVKIVPMNQLEVPSDSIIIDAGSTFTAPSTKDSITATGQTNKIELGYLTYAKEDGSDRQSLIGLDVPKPVVRLSAKIVQPTTTATYHHRGISESDFDDSLVNFNNPIHQANISTECVDNGIQYYDYQIAIPKAASNITVYAASAAEDPNKAIKMQYDTIANNQSTHIKETLNVKIVDELRSVSGSDAYEYHLSGEDGWHFLGNPNGQFHIYSRCEGQTFESDAEVIEYLNSTYTGGIRILKENGEYDLTQAGWVVSANTVSDNTTKSSLYAFDYRKKSDGTPISTQELASTSYNVTTDTFKGWFKVQQFESSFTSSPQQIILIGDQNNSGEDWGNISTQEKTNLQSRGLWFQSMSANDGGKWWL